MPTCGVKLALEQARQCASLRFLKGRHSHVGDFDLPLQPPAACVTPHMMNRPIIRESSLRSPSVSPVR